MFIISVTSPSCLYCIPNKHKSQRKLSFVLISFAILAHSSTQPYLMLPIQRAILKPRKSIKGSAFVMSKRLVAYGGTRFLAPPQCICCYLSFAILPRPVPAPYFSGVFSGKKRRMHIQYQKYLSGMAYSIFKELL